MKGFDRQDLPLGAPLSAVTGERSDRLPIATLAALRLARRLTEEDGGGADRALLLMVLRDVVGQRRSVVSQDAEAVLIADVCGLDRDATWGALQKSERGSHACKVVVETESLWRALPEVPVAFSGTREHRSALDEHWVNDALSRYPRLSEAIAQLERWWRDLVDRHDRELAETGSGETRAVAELRGMGEDVARRLAEQEARSARFASDEKTAREELESSGYNIGRASAETEKEGLAARKRRSADLKIAYYKRRHRQIENTIAVLIDRPRASRGDPAA